ncbi:MAG: hypothetical protein ACI90V_004986 [Bacillariaceae sp.]|jgi:hypothetical protein
MFVTKTNSNSNSNINDNDGNDDGDDDDDDDRLVFDITDDETGRLHSVARFHIPPFVNEVTDPNNNKNSNSNINSNGNREEEQSVYPAFDCQGTYSHMA